MVQLLIVHALPYYGKNADPVIFFLSRINSVARRNLIANVGRVFGDDVLLCHTVAQTLSFDLFLEEQQQSNKVGVEVGVGIGIGMRVIEVITNNKHRLQTWLKVELAAVNFKLQQGE